MNSLLLRSNSTTIYLSKFNLTANFVSRFKLKMFQYAICAMVTLAGIAPAYAQTGINGVITGHVKTSDGKPAGAVNIALQGTSKGATVNQSGYYIIHNIKPGRYQLVASFIGLATQIKQVEVHAADTITVDFMLRESSQQLNEVVVSSRKANRFSTPKSNDAAKMPLNNLENPQVYSTVTSALMAEQSAFTMDDALKNVSGINRLWAATDRSGFGNGSSFALRGFQLNTSLRNGLPSNVSTTVDAANIESIEVLKGPSATLFGSAVTSYGGLINRVTKKPYDHVGGEIAYSGGSYGFNRLSADVNTPLDSAKNLLFRINTSLNTQKTWQDAGFHNSIFVAPSLTYKVNDRLSFSFDAELYKSEGTTPTTFFFYATVPQLGVSSADKLNLDYNRSYISNDLVLRSSNLNFNGQMNYKLSDNWTSQTNISVVNTNSYGPMPYFYLLPGNNQIARNVWTIDGYDRTLDIQQNFVGKFNIGTVKNRLVAGIDYYNYNANVVYHEFMGTAGGQTAADLFDVINSTGKIPNYLNFNKAKVDSAYANSPAATNPYIIANKQYITSAYVSDVVNITDQLIVNAALRIDHFNNTGNYDPISGTTSGGFKQTALSPKFGVVYQVVKDRVSLFGNFQNGFTNETGTDYAGRSFKPQQANQLEGGVKLNAFDGKLSGTISYYDIKVNNILRTDVDHPNFSIQNGTQLSKGLEVEIIANPFTGFNIVAGYAHNNSKYTNADDDVNGLRPNSSGPEDMANLWLSYRITKGAAKGLGAGFGGNYSGKSLVVSSKSSGQFYVPEYTVLNSSVFYDAGKFRLAASVNNLTNKKYWIGWYTVNPQQLRSITGSIAFRF
ncbi:TonB-dependent receptor [Mucilaginibacter sp. FT3.2]|uniref:TonB-dependent receptor n=1 Tax=Mucilaginibacter sp. FT3.2 TaxID=2723090 RepID=UPI00161D7CF7|nr:TonB-dependent receptor [Mucilaginibacter sp. FT3.2]MBB6234508.1 iron complex outermembrane receptor protein [Mucilaginibacter sp. FT3.2]